MRPKLYEESFLLRMPKGTAEALRQKATHYGQTVSEYLRQLVRKAIQHEGDRG